MESVAAAAFRSWPLDARVIALLLIASIVYWRGWLRGRRLLRGPNDTMRLAAFQLGLLVIFVAAESPLDAFDSLFLSAHMAQHLLLMMVAPPLLLLGEPFLPLLRGLPKGFVKEGLGPFLTCRPLKEFSAWLTGPIPAALVFAASTLAWHLPQMYELALSSPAWHGAQHASFFWTGVLFWWIVIQPGPGKPHWPRWVVIPYLLFADVLNSALSVVFVFSNHLIYPSYAAVRASQMTALQDQNFAGLLMWVPGSIIYLVPAFAVVISLFSPEGRSSAVPPVRVRRRPANVTSVWWKSAPLMRRMAQAAMLLMALFVIKEGFTGQQVAPLNAAGTLPWIHWRALSIFALLVVGNLFCLACPFVLVRDVTRRLISPRWRWPRALRNKWPAIVLLVIYFWAYEAFALWDSPWLTAWLITGYFGAAIIVDTLFKGASFCKYVCPVGQYHFVMSLVSPREIAVREHAVCRGCRTHDCIKGNAQARGCELYLFQPKKVGNLDCTFCLDCVKACPHDNVGLLPVVPAKTLISDGYRSSIGRLSKRSDLTALVLLLVFGAFVNAAGMVGPVMMWEHHWHARLGVHAMPYIVAGFVVAGAVLLPILLFRLCSLFSVRQTARRMAYTLVPLGAAMWAAHLLFHAAIYWTPASVTWLQILLLDAGLLAALYFGWRVAEARLKVWAPWAVTACGLFLAGVWIFFQPMQMRGMMH